MKEKITTVKVICITTSLLGMMLVSGALKNPLEGINDCIGIGYGIAAAVSYASLTLLNKFTRELSSIEATIAQLVVASVILLPYSLLTNDLENITVGIEAIILLLILGVAHTGLKGANRCNI